jgi:hypothetical protein
MESPSFFGCRSLPVILRSESHSFSLHFRSCRRRRRTLDCGIVKRLLLCIAPLLLSVLGVHALMVQGYDPAVNDRFASGYPDAPLPNSGAKFLGKDLDWSGVGWWKKDPQYSVTLLSSKNFAYTKHMAPQTGDVITFLGRDGHLHDYHVAKLQMVELGKQGGDTVFADTAVGTFDETVPLDDQVTHYPVAFSQKGMDPFIGKKILMYGHMARIGTNEIVEGIMLENVASEYNFDTRGLTNGMGKSEVGDAGSPSFLVIDGKLALVGTHWKDDTDSMVSGIIPGINAIMAADGARLEVVPVGD